MHIYSVTDPEFKPYGRVWDDVPSALTAPLTEALSATPIPEGSKYVASAPELEQVEGAVMLDRVEIDPAERYALVFGNEVEGVSQQAVDMCDGAIEIPQAGTKHSLNVSVAGGVVLWPFFAALRSLVG